MKVIQTLTRIYVSQLDDVVPFYENLFQKQTTVRFKHPAGMELASIGDVLIIAGKEQDLKPFKQTVFTLLVDSVEEYKEFLSKNGGTVIRDISDVPTGKNMTMQHLDGTIVEYIEFK